MGNKKFVNKSVLKPKKFKYVDSQYYSFLRYKLPDIIEYIDPNNCQIQLMKNLRDTGILTKGIFPGMLLKFCC